ncbi:MAG: NAD(+) diphosphatase [Halioglobus sp.]
MFQPSNKPPTSYEGGVHIVFQRGELVSDMRQAEPCMIDRRQLEIAGWQERQRLFLGFWRDQACFAVEIEPADELDPMVYQRGNLYQVLGRIDEQLFALAGRASQLLAWERDHQHCGRCGAAMRMDIDERAMCCDPCGTINYPRIAPCIIVLITRGEEMLLARNANFPRPMYSTLAGFIEAGESAEETLVREVREEVGVEVANIRYFQSQSWPFPSQLMLGYFAEYAGGDIVCDMEEIADAQWFHYRDLPMIPPVSSISGQLIQHYVNSFR